jgi:outer membrane immunogenic protein
LSNRGDVDAADGCGCVYAATPLGFIEEDYASICLVGCFIFFINYCEGSFFASEEMMKQLALGVLLASIAGAACAADLPAPGAPYSKAPAVVSPAINWSGFYIGAMGGYASENTSDPIGIKGGFGGGTVGYNWQFGTIVAGIEADGAWANVSASESMQDPVLGLITATAKVDALATVRGRIGAAFDQILLYGTGGLALSDAKASATALGLTVSDNKTQTGWTLGAGAEWMFLPRWSLKAEYLYRRLESVTLFAVSTGALAVNSGQFGVNYHF